jgi:hypothetical protein
MAGFAAWGTLARLAIVGLIVVGVQAAVPTASDAQELKVSLNAPYDGSNAAFPCG